MAIGLGKMLGFEFQGEFPIIRILSDKHHRILATVAYFAWEPGSGSMSTFLWAETDVNTGQAYLESAGRSGLCTGLWHGASLELSLVWGLYYGLLLTLEKYVLLKYLERAPKSPAARLYDGNRHDRLGFLLLQRASLGDAASLLGVMFGFGDHPLTDDTGLYYLTSNLLLIGIMVRSFRDRCFTSCWTD